MIEKAGGCCSMCGDIATQIASYNMAHYWNHLK